MHQRQDTDAGRQRSGCSWGIGEGRTLSAIGRGIRAVAVGGARRCGDSLRRTVGSRLTGETLVYIVRILISAVAAYHTLGNGGGAWRGNIVCGAREADIFLAIVVCRTGLAVYQ